MSTIWITITFTIGLDRWTDVIGNMLDTSVDSKFHISWKRYYLFTKHCSYSFVYIALSVNIKILSQRPIFHITYPRIHRKKFSTLCKDVWIGKCVLLFMEDVRFLSEISWSFIPCTVNLLNSTIQTRHRSEHALKFPCWSCLFQFDCEYNEFHCF